MNVMVGIKYGHTHIRVNQQNTLATVAHVDGSLHGDKAFAVTARARVYHIEGAGEEFDLTFDDPDAIFTIDDYEGEIQEGFDFFGWAPTETFKNGKNGADCIKDEQKTENNPHRRRGRYRYNRRPRIGDT